MSDENRPLETARRLKRLFDQVELSRADKVLAERCMRRLAQPLRVTVFGTDPRHAISLINLMVGQPVVSPSLPRGRIQFVHGEQAQARVQYRDGTQRRFEGAEFRQVFEDNPSRVKLAIDLPVLKKLSILVATEPNAVSLCEDIDKTLTSADITLWAGAELSEPLIGAWESLPDRLRDHSYLILSPEMDFANWKPIAQEFVEVIRVDPQMAQEAKAAEGGVDKEAFRASGGAQIVKTIKKEIDILVQSALDAADLLLARYGDQMAPVTAPEAAAPAPTEPSQRERQAPVREQVYSVPLGKLASRSRLVGSPVPQKPRTVSMAIKNMPKVTSRPASKVSTKPRTRSRKSGPGATPWSLGL
ncbi:MAG: hypothetical protein ACU0GG_06535 [Paracoccaceae bacterium]